MDAVQQVVREVTKKNTFDDPTRTSFVTLWIVFVIMALSGLVFLGQIFTSKHPDTLSSPKKRHCKDLASHSSESAPAWMSSRFAGSSSSQPQSAVADNCIILRRLYVYDRDYRCPLILCHGKASPVTCA